MLSRKIFSAEDPNKSKELRELFQRSDQMLEFWQTFLPDCLDPTIRGKVKIYLDDYKRNGSFSAVQIDNMIAWANKKNFIG